MNAQQAAERLQQGKMVERYKESGNSMRPIIKHRQPVDLEPVKSVFDLEVGDVVLCKVKGRFYLHLVKSCECSRVLIGNNHGRVNGWTDKVYGRVVRVHPN